jgi:NhaP-type Na+/H+ or K+/H+ antiporter
MSWCHGHRLPSTIANFTKHLRWKQHHHQFEFDWRNVVFEWNHLWSLTSGITIRFLTCSLVKLVSGDEWTRSSRSTIVHLLIMFGLFPFCYENDADSGIVPAYARMSIL